ncbi:hypothetical protein [Paenibacillus sp. 1-18]|uniref:hypothetical protein n=1 Tax=Paenibacillus sp. 1-18 TaxID=1333846 RepID=UPI000470AFFE|nr:hypothetical protein [Paenibacillus sp. 1-18]
MFRIKNLKEAINERLQKLDNVILASAKLLMDDVNQKTGSNWRVIPYGAEPGYWKGEEEDESFGWDDLHYPIVDEYFCPNDRSIRLAIPILDTDAGKSIMLYLDFEDSEEYKTTVSIHTANSLLCSNALNMGSAFEHGSTYHEYGIARILDNTSIGFYDSIVGYTSRDHDRSYQVTNFEGELVIHRYSDSGQMEETEVLTLM